MKRHKGNLVSHMMIFVFVVSGICSFVPVCETSVVKGSVYIVEYISKYVREQARQAGRLISFSYCWGKVISKKIQSSKSKTRSVMTDFQDSLAPTLVNICFSFLISKSN